MGSVTVEATPDALVCLYPISLYDFCSFPSYRSQTQTPRSQTLNTTEELILNASNVESSGSG